MCLNTKEKKPFKAKRDIVVCKYLVEKDGEYFTPCQGVKVHLDDTMIPSYKDKPSRYDNKSSYTINGGYIHAIIGSLKNRNWYKTKPFKAIIPKGTDFYIGQDDDIAATRLQLTDKPITDEELKESYKDIITYLLDNVEEHNSIRVGDIYLSDGTFAHYEDYDDEKMNDRVIGVIGYFINKKPVPVSLQQERLPWLNDENHIYQPVHPIDSVSDANKDYDGQKRTDDLLQLYKNQLNAFPALKYCVEYKTKGTKKGDWYFPSSGEVLMLIQNRVLINVSLSKIKNAGLITSDDWYWSSAESSSTNAWNCITTNAYVNFWGTKWGWNYVRPSLALTA